MSDRGPLWPSSVLSPKIKIRVLLCFRMGRFGLRHRGGTGEESDPAGDEARGRRQQKIRPAGKLLVRLLLL